MTTNDRNRVIELLNKWPDHNYPADIRNELVGLAVQYGFPRNELGNFIETLLARDPHLVKKEVTGVLGIHQLAQEMLNAGYTGQLMRDEINARDYICMAADNPDVENELPEAGFAFWRAAPISYKKWKARQKYGFNEG